MDAPIKYNDPAYDLIDQRAEARVGLKPGVLSAIRLHGERSNANQVSSAGARSVYQITPTTRNLILKKYGVDPYLSAQNAALGSALILKEAHDRNGGDTLKAVREYIGGTNPKNWGKTTASYVSRVAKALNPINTANAAELPSQELIDEFHAWQAKQQQSAQPPQEQQAPPPEQAQLEQAQPQADQALIDEFHAWQAKQQQAQQSDQAQSEHDALMLNTIGQGVMALPGSIANMGAGLIDAGMHPVDTAENIGKLGVGAIQSALPPIIPYENTPFGDQRKVFAQLADNYKKTYGTLAGFKDAIKSDPARILSDAAMVGGVVSKIPGLAKAAELARAVDPIAQTGNVIGKTSKVIPEILGASTGVGSTAVKEAYKAGKAGGSAGEAFLGAANGGQDIADILPTVKQAVNSMRDERASNYAAAMRSVGENPEVINMDHIENVAKAATLGKYKDYVFNPKSAAIQNEILAEIQKFKELPAVEYHTAEGADKLKRALGEIRDSTEFHTPARVVADRAYHAVKDAIIKEAPEYGKAMKDYESLSKQLNEIEKTFSLGDKTSIDTAIRKFQSLLRNNANTNYGNRGKLFDELVKHGAGDVLPALAGQAMNTWTPRGIQGMVPSLTAGASLAHPGALLTLPAQSPRFVGNAAYGLGAGVRQATNAIPSISPLQQTALTNSAARFGNPNNYNQEQQ